MIHMEMTDAHEINPNNDEYIAKILEDLSRNGRNMFEFHDTLDIPENDPCAKLHEFDSCSESLALLRSLGNFDPSQTPPEESLVVSNDTYDGIINTVTTTDEKQTTKVREFIDSSSASAVSDFSRGLSPILSIHLEPPLKTSIGPPPPLFSLTEEFSSFRSRLASNDLDVSHNGRCQSSPKKGSTVEKNQNPQPKLCKRKKARLQEEADQLAREIDIWGPPDEEDGDPDDTTENDKNHRISHVLKSRSKIYSEDRLESLNSAAVLFRRPSAASRKYTRAPISKIFVSLDLTVENFLKIQAAAKTYMLDERFPERSDSVGSKHRADNELKKLKLYTCVKNFLEEEGWGERCFGLKAEGGELRKLKWPESKNKIIQLITPLMRRMVTNERQRRYALEARLEKRSRNPTKDIKDSEPPNLSAKSDSSTDIPDTEPSSSLTCALKNNQKNDTPHQQITPTDNLDLHLKQSQVIKEYEEPVTSCHSLDYHESICTAQIGSPSEFKSAPLYYYINFVWDSCYVKRRLILKPSECPTFSRLVRHISESVDHVSEEINSIKVHGPNGLTTVFDEKTWAQAISLVSKHEWMDQDIRCLVNMEPSASQQKI